MIKSILLKNFKSYKNQLIEFHKGITIIKGEGLSGKSNIVRAIDLLRNYTSKKRLKSTFALNNEELKIELITEENKITLLKNKQPKFILNDSQEFRKIGNKSPQEIIEVLQLNQLNIQKQLEQPFIIHKNASQLTKTINSIIGIEKIDSFIQKINSRLKTNKVLLSREQQELENLKSKQKAFNNLPNIRIKIREVKKISTKIEEKEIKLISLNELINSLKEKEDKLSKLEKKARIELDLRSLDFIQEKIDNYEIRLKEISLLINRIIGCQDLENSYKKEYRNILRLYISELKKVKSCPVCKSIIDNEKIQRIKKELKNEIYLDK